MRILVVTNLYPNPRQPHRAPFNRAQIRALAGEHEVRVIAPVAWTSGAVAAGPHVSNGVVVHHPRYLYTPKVFRGMYGHFFERCVRPCFEREVDGWGPDVVLGCWAYPDGWAAVRLGREAGLPVVIKIHGSDVLTLDHGPRRARTAEALRSADAVVAVSRVLRERAVGLGAAPERTRVVYNGIDSELFRPGSRAEARGRLGVAGSERLVLFVGNLVPVKGPDVLIDALALVRDKGVSFRCVCIGQGRMKRGLEGRIRALGLAGAVELVGTHPQEVIADWYRAADLLVLPSRSEGVPNVLLEAGACGTPCIASKVGGVPEICDPLSLVSPREPAELADRIRLFLDPATRPGIAGSFVPGSWRESAVALGAVLRAAVEGRTSKLAA